MPVPPDYMIYGPSPEDVEEDRVERMAADLWREDHPTMSVFRCDEAMKQRYRARAVAILRTNQNGEIERRPLVCAGVRRSGDSLNAIEFNFNRPATDDEMRFLREVMQRAAACLPR